MFVEMSLFGSYLKTAIRNLARHRIYSAINIIGIAIGLAFCIITFLFVHQEWTYDTFHENADRIYRVYVQTSSGIAEKPRVPDGAALTEAFPEMQTARLVGGAGRIGTDDRAFQAFWSYVDPNFLEIFSFPVIRGEPDLQDKYSALITKKVAQKYFNNANAIGEVLPIQRFNPMLRKNEIKNYTVTGILKNVPKNSTLQFDLLLPFEQSGVADNKRFMADTYMLLPPNVNPNSLEQQFPKWTKTWWGEKSENQLKLQPLTQMHFDQTLAGWYSNISNPVYTYILSGIALLVLFIACVNFITLTLGRQATRAREVGLRKVVGAGRLQIAKQFIGESLLLIVIALIAGIAIAELSLPIFNNLAGKSLSMSDGLNLTTLAFLILLVSLVGITAGGYPALILSRLQPTQIITSRLQMKTGNRFGKVLVIFQFGLSIFFIITTLMIGKQLTFLRTKPLGYQTEHIVAIQTPALRRESKTLPTVFRDALLSHPSVISTTWFGDNSLVNFPISLPPNIFVSYEDIQEQPVKMMSIDYDVFKTLDIKLVAGREYSEEFPTDKNRSIIVNEALVEKLGIEDPIGKTIKDVRKTRSRLISRSKTIIGVVRDFHFRSLHHKIGPVIMPPFTTNYSNLLVRIHPENVPGTIAFMKEKWKEIAPNQAFRFSFLNENIDRQYYKEKRWNLMIQYATGFAIFIAALGAFGLTALATTRRTKEIGIRKVLGASRAQILSLLSREFVLYIALASLIAFPIAYYATNQWLQTFAYRTELGIGAFLLGSVAMFLVVLITVTAQALKAARANPADALRDE